MLAVWDRTPASGERIPTGGGQIRVAEEGIPVEKLLLGEGIPDGKDQIPGGGEERQR